MLLHDTVIEWTLPQRLGGSFMSIVLFFFVWLLLLLYCTRFGFLAQNILTKNELRSQPNPKARSSWVDLTLVLSLGPDKTEFWTGIHVLIMSRGRFCASHGASRFSKPKQTQHQKVGLLDLFRTNNLQTHLVYGLGNLKLRPCILLHVRSKN